MKRLLGSMLLCATTAAAPKATPANRLRRALVFPALVPGLLTRFAIAYLVAGIGVSPQSPTQPGRTRSACSASSPSSSRHFSPLSHPICCQPPSKTGALRKRPRGDGGPVARNCINAEPVPTSLDDGWVRDARACAERDVGAASVITCVAKGLVTMWAFCSAK
jgi:hypothetical protein